MYHLGLLTDHIVDCEAVKAEVPRLMELIFHLMETTENQQFIRPLFAFVRAYGSFPEKIFPYLERFATFTRSSLIFLSHNRLVPLLLSRLRMPERIPSLVEIVTKKIVPHPNEYDLSILPTEMQERLHIARTIGTIPALQRPN